MEVHEGGDTADELVVNGNRGLLVLGAEPRGGQRLIAV